MAEEKEEYDYKEKKGSNYTFRTSSKVMIAIVAIVALVIGFAAGFIISGPATTGMATGDAISTSEAQKIAQDYIQNVVGAGSTVSVSNFKNLGNVYIFDVEIDGDAFTSYMSLDGKFLFPSAYDLTEEIEPSEQQEPTKAEVSADDDAVKGDPDAPVTIIEFSDYECPFCARFFSETLPQIEKEYIDTGKVKLVYRDFPLGFHANAQKAAEAAECAGEQDKYYEMHDKLFEDGVSVGVGSFKQYAADIGLDTAAFNDCLDSGSMADEVAKDMADGQTAGVSGTPAFFVNSQFISGAQSFSAFKTAIEKELSK